METSSMESISSLLSKRVIASPLGLPQQYEISGALSSKRGDRAYVAAHHYIHNRSPKVISRGVVNVDLFVRMYRAALCAQTTRQCGDTIALFKTADAMAAGGGAARGDRRADTCREYPGLGRVGKTALDIHQETCPLRSL
jgi:hypothetical protein